MSNNELSDEDKKAFAQAMEKVTPLKSPHRNRAVQRNRTPSEKHPQQRLQATEHQHQSQSYDHEFINTDHWVDAETVIAFRSPGLNPKTWRRLVAGDISIENKLDLHHYTAAQSYDLVAAFIQHCQEHGLRFVLVIHGKGRNPKSKPILKNLLNQWLRERKDILAFHTAQPKHGGGGATYLLLKKPKQPT